MLLGFVTKLIFLLFVDYFLETTGIDSRRSLQCRKKSKRNSTEKYVCMYVIRAEYTAELIPNPIPSVERNENTRQIYKRITMRRKGRFYKILSAL